MSIRHSIESTPLGTAGPIIEARELLDDDFFVLNGDVFVDMKLPPLMEFHQNNRALATLVVHSSDHPADSDVVLMDSASRIMRLFHKPGRDVGSDVCSAGLCVLNKKAVALFPKGTVMTLEKELISRAIDAGQVYGYSTAEYLKDMGTPERLRSVARYCENKARGIAWILDRDGVINEELSTSKIVHLLDASQFRLIPRAGEAIKLLNDAGFFVVVASNQPAVAKNLCTEEDVHSVNSRMEKELARYGARIDAIYICPHHPEQGHPEANDPKYRKDCECRKPKPGMFLQAARDLGIDLSLSTAVGDKTSDILAGKNAGCKTILVRTGYAGEDKKYPVQPDQTAQDLYEAVIHHA